MPNWDYTHKPLYWRMRAEEARSIAEGFSVDECRERMLRVAEEYEVIAHCLEVALRELLEMNSEERSPRNVTPFRPAG